MKKLLILIGFATLTMNAQVKKKIIAKPKSQTVYKSVKINNYEWMTSNLNEKKFRNGDVIPQAQSKEEWVRASQESKPAWCYYQIGYSKIKNYGDPSTGLYGVLYNWHAVNDPRKLAPVGWHVSSIHEWHDLFNYFGGLYGHTFKEIGTKLQSTKYWNDGYSETFNGTNSSGFNALPGGERWEENGMFREIGSSAYWWCSDMAYDRPYFINMNAGSSYYFSSEVVDNNGEYKDGSVETLGGGMSVRCVKD